MSKLTQETFELLQDGLDALIERKQEEVTFQQERIDFEESIKNAEEELIAIGTF